MTEILETLRLTRRFNAAPERVFDAWIDPGRARRWLFTSQTSERHSTELDVRVGGKWTIIDRRDGVDYTALGEYVEIDRPRRLVFTFGMPQFSPLSCTVTVEIVSDGDGCILTLSQDKLAPEAREPVEQGWMDMFDALAGLVEEDARGALAGSVGLPRAEALARLDEARRRTGHLDGPTSLDDLRRARGRDD